jgi:hypothetical protein
MDKEALARETAALVKRGLVRVVHGIPHLTRNGAMKGTDLAERGRPAELAPEDELLLRRLWTIAKNGRPPARIRKAGTPKKAAPTRRRQKRTQLR